MNNKKNAGITPKEARKLGENHGNRNNWSPDRRNTFTSQKSYNEYSNVYKDTKKKKN